MHRFAVSLLALGLAAITGIASAQSYPASYDDRSNGAYGHDASDTYFDYARVIRVDPIIGRDNRYRPSSNDRNCYRGEGFQVDRDDDGRYDDRYRNEGRYRDDDRYAGHDGNGYYDRDGRYHEGRTYGTQTGRNVATVLGGLVGAALGSKVGGGSARYATAAVGSMVGGMAGREIYETSQRQKRQAYVTVCDPVRDDARYTPTEDVIGYDVTYEYAGREYTTRTDHHPGDRIRVRVDVRAE